MGRKKRPFYRVVVADARAPRDGRFIESIGYYNPMTDPAEVNFKEDRVFYWLSNGAQPTDTVKSLLRKQGLWLKWDLIKRNVDPAKIEEEFKKWQEANELKRKRLELLKQQEEEKKRKEEEKKKKEAEKAAAAEAEEEKAAEPSEGAAQEPAEAKEAGEEAAKDDQNGEPEKDEKA
jgi:small subunit ribosomal protein S16